MKKTAPPKQQREAIHSLQKAFAACEAANLYFIAIEPEDQEELCSFRIYDYDELEAAMESHGPGAFDMPDLPRAVLELENMLVFAPENPDL
ncbi:hypothetical protein CSB45_06110 [candidate division KSB3 bacterium]|uniref:Uncharacterized protein n=1 Tax=candidate division KSB3 bacterium TaxID=2044937 RepID=A0A2G6E6X1_9BACT|nr:MAG: hypothetical protein CSB45_06110 [candidate division KSB3 bacterium]PIE30219.1 MAG: hypothetical protein CSA57_04825 [candidate division KSB3 bacterium]